MSCLDDQKKFKHIMPSKKSMIIQHPCSIKAEIELFLKGITSELRNDKTKSFKTFLHNFLQCCLLQTKWLLDKLAPMQYMYSIVQVMWSIYAAEQLSEMH